MGELVSIIMPSYNTARYIEESVNSVLGQTYTNWELLIVDDCSTDNTDEIIKRFNDERIIYVKNEKNSGAAISRNRALKMAKGKWIAFLDSDDLWTKDKLEKQIAFMEKQHCRFSYTAYEEIDENSKNTGIKVKGPRKVTKRGMYNYCWLGCLTVMYDAEYIGEIQIADLKKNNDYAMWLKVIEKADCFFLDEVLAEYRIRSGSISRQSKLKLIKHHYRLYRKGQGRDAVSSSFLTVRNLFWGFYKKIKYVKGKKI